MPQFIDTSILIYAIGGKQFVPFKTARAQELLDLDDCALSAQVLQEFYVQATRPSRAGALTHEEAVGLIAAWARFPVYSTSLQTIRAALEIEERHRLSYWDAAIVAAAQALGCATLYSEDMGHGMTIGGTRIVNPFL